MNKQETCGKCEHAHWPHKTPTGRPSRNYGGECEEGKRITKEMKLQALPVAVVEVSPKLMAIWPDMDAKTCRFFSPKGK